jgi:quercetin dioxygenase-like cupin family protein
VRIESDEQHTVAGKRHEVTRYRDHGRGETGDAACARPTVEPDPTREDAVTDADEPNRRLPVVLAPGEGRCYPMGRVDACFKADGDETAGRYSISEWWLEPHTRGPGGHQHPEDDVFYVLQGTVTFLMDDEWLDASAGSFVLVPGGVTHAFDNRTDSRAGMLNVSAPGDFERAMPPIAEWFRARSDADADC